MVKSGISLVLCGAAMFLTGCGTQFGGASSAAKGGMAVVDLDKVAAETGKNIQMKEIFQVQENSVKQQLAKLSFSAKAQLDAKSKEFGESPTDEQKKELAQFSLNANNILVRADREGSAKLSQYRQDQIAKFRTEIKPIAQEIAAKRGLSIVIPKNEGLLLAVDPGVDITEDVIKAYREKRPAQPTAPAAASPSPTAAKPQAGSAPARTAAVTEEESEEADKQ
jgi:Skp family chaperone for outer membrane proteins